MALIVSSQIRKCMRPSISEKRRENKGEKSKSENVLRFLVRSAWQINVQAKKSIHKSTIHIINFNISDST